MAEVAGQSGRPDVGLIVSRMQAYSPEVWDGFFGAQAAASAALAGLVFVGVSINLKAILEAPGLVLRSLEALILLGTLLVISVFGVVPGQSPDALGWELLVVGVLTWIWVTWVLVRSRPAHASWSDGREVRLAFRLRVLIMQAATIPQVLGGLTLLIGAGGGLRWTVAATVGGFVGALFDAWVLLIEILR
jgi:modulator of FtsH protease